MGQKAKYENKNRIYGFVIRRFLKRINDGLKIIKPLKVIDVGSAEGYVINYLRTNNDSPIEFLGTDIDKEALDRAKTMNVGSRFETCDILDVGDKYKNERFDLVMAIEILEHINDYQKAIESLCRIDSKYFLFSVPHEPYFQTINFLRGKYMSTYGNVPDHVNHWSKKRFKKLVSHRFEIIKDLSFFPWTILLLKKK